MTNTKKRILVVDDDPKILKALDQALQQEGYEVYRAEDGLQALEMARKVKPDLMILDVMLPKMDGFEVLAQLQSEGGIPTLILSARGEEMDKVVGFNVGADDYLVKPFRLSELLLRVRAILRRTAGARAPIDEDRPLKFKDIEIHRSSRTVIVRGKPVDLTPKEFAGLHMLLESGGEPVSHRDLVRTVWDENLDPRTSAVRATVSRLRTKLGGPGTIGVDTGRGYRLMT